MAYECYCPLGTPTLDLFLPSYQANLSIRSLAELDTKTMPPLRDPERTYVSTIYENSNYYASWAPSRPVRVSDFHDLWPHNAN